ncbi:MAG TPA: hypothetical protein DCL77_14505 [Prolixibacteraceae bacterium]|jgi:hypothetical protein|nr:hypothetical protein [Prolixibacteraceae bacterium]
MAKKNFTGGLASLMSGPQTDKELKDSKEIKDPSKEVRDNRDFSDTKAFKEGWTKKDWDDAEDKTRLKTAGHEAENDHGTSMSANSRLRANKGYGRKTFIMEAELSEKIAAWSWFKRMAEKKIAAQAFELFFGEVDEKELRKAVRSFRESGE